MNQSSIDNSKKKFPHSASKLIFSGTYFDHHKICYFIQCETYEVIIGEANSKFTTLWRGTVKPRITCITHCHKNHIIYAGNIKGAIITIDLKNDGNFDKIDSIDGEPILTMFAYSNQANQQPQLIAINAGSKIIHYKNNKYSNSIKLPFSVAHAISNKTIKHKNDVAIVLLKQKGTYPYLLSAQFLIQLTQKEQITQQQKEGGDNKEKAAKMIEQYEASLNYEADESVKTQEVSFMALSNSKAVLAISTGLDVSIYAIVKKGCWFQIVPDFKFRLEDEVTNIDIVDTLILYLSSRGISTYDLEKRKKVAKGLVFKGTEYDIIHWAEVGNSILYGSTKASKMKMILCQLKGLAQE